MLRLVVIGLTHFLALDVERKNSVALHFSTVSVKRTVCNISRGSLQAKTNITKD